MIKWKDVAHLYLPVPVELDNGGSKVYNRTMVAVGNTDDEYRYMTLRMGKGGKSFHHSVFFSQNVVKPILRPLSDVTEEEWLHIFSLAKGIIIKDDSIYKIAKHSTNEVCISVSSAQFLLSYQENYNADVRVPTGFSFRLKYLYTSNSLEVTEVGINEVKNDFTPTTDEWDNFCFNQSGIFIYLLSRHFDLFSLLETNQAIKK